MLESGQSEANCRQGDARVGHVKTEIVESIDLRLNIQSRTKLESLLKLLKV